VSFKDTDAMPVAVQEGCCCGIAVGDCF